MSAPNAALLYIIASPVGPYFPTGFKPVTLLADSKYVRSWAGGVGQYKMAAWVTSSANNFLISVAVMVDMALMITL